MIAVNRGNYRMKKDPLMSDMPPRYDACALYQGYGIFF